MLSMGHCCMFFLYICLQFCVYIVFEKKKSGKFTKTIFYFQKAAKKTVAK